MNDEHIFKLWVIKFCLKVIFPKYNFFVFLVYLAIKYRIHCTKQHQLRNNMDTFKIKTTSANVQRLLLRESIEDTLSNWFNKCMIISQMKFKELASQNLFYLDNGALWMALKLSNDFKERYMEKTAIDKKTQKYDLNYVTSEIHRKLWTDETQSLDKIRIVLVGGSSHIQGDIVFASENEYYNILTFFGLDATENDVGITFHPVPAFDCAPQIASAAEVNLLVNEFDLSSDFIKEILSNHFETPKLVTANDIFSVELSPENTGKYHFKYFDLVEFAGKLHFKCKKIESNPSTNANISSGCGENNKTNQSNILQYNNHIIYKPYFIVKGVTQLTLGENIHNLKPKDEYFNQYNALTREKISSLHACPYGLKKKFNQIQESICPFLHRNLSELLSSLSSPIIPIFLLSGTIGSGRHLLVKTLAKYNGMNCLQIDCNALQSSTAKQTESKINATIQKAKAASPVIVLLDNFEVFAVDPESNEDCRILEHFENTINTLYQNYTKHAIIFIAVTENSDLKPNILRIFLEKFHIPRLKSKERLEMLQWFVTTMQLKFNDVQENLQKTQINFDQEISTLNPVENDILQRLAAKTETFLYGDMDTLVHFALRESYLKQQSNCNESAHDIICDIHEDDFNSALETMRNLQSQHLDAPKIPKVYWEDIGGLDKLKKELLKTIEFPIKYPHLFKNSTLKRSGILLYGPPGCGKTLVAKAVSTELNVSFLSVKGPELLNMYIGQSEENVRKVFESARASSPCIVFLDELDALAPRRGAAGDSGGASDRVVSQLLAEVDGVAYADDADSSNFVFIMGATNRPDLLEQSLLRPGRLDKLIYVGPYSGQDEKTKVLKALCRSHKLRAEVKLEDVAAALPERCTGADLLQIVSTARSAAVRALVDKLHKGAVKESELSTDSIILGVSELWEGVKNFRPSVTDEELIYYESLQSQI